MTTIAVLDVAHLRYRGYDEPQFPTGIWRVHGSNTGDATGGQNTIQCDFSKSSQPFNSQLYSLEQLMLGHSVAAQGVEVALANFEVSLISAIYTANIVANEGTTPAAISAESLNAFRGLWLGQAVNRSTAQNIRFTIDNGNGEIFRVLAYGYVWSARSINAPGGPQRPPSGLFR